MVQLTPQQRQMFRDARKARALTVYSVDGISASTIGNIENGDRAHHVPTLLRLAAALGMDPETVRNAGLPEVANPLALRADMKQRAAVAAGAITPPA